ncbi:hypothetical protein AwDysgo_03250 [Bacteroidales bacterium]|nr:hypothetical protein AwDysgo_03250 [Bacteroidales bacterium]
MYLEGKYAETKDFFEKQVQAAPRNASFNQWYGNCLLETGELAKAEKYLRFASSKEIPEAYYSLGRLFYKQNRFEESVDSFGTYYDFLMSKHEEEKAMEIRKHWYQARNAARMLANCEDIQIIDSLIVDKKTFLDHIFLSEESGQFSYSGDKETVVYENQLQDKRYFSKADKDGNLSLFYQNKLQNNWSEDLALKLPTDSLDQNNYPFVLSDGLTLYFASQGHGSIGGYDLFVTAYNLNSDSYLSPKQLGMPFNSIYNDYFLAIDEYNGLGYFVSDRFLPEDKLVIYTFIPNEEITLVGSEDMNVLLARSEVRSIKDTWKKDSYASLLEQRNTNNTKKTNLQKHEFIFVINDNIVYRFFDEFENETAKGFYTQSQSLRKDISFLHDDLENERLLYSKGNTSTKNAMQASIISKENKLEGLQDNFKKMEIKARNAEIKYLRQNK